MNETWNAVRRNHSDALNRLDFKALELVAGGRVFLTTSGKDVTYSRTNDGRAETWPCSMKKLLRLRLVDTVEAGEKYRLNEDGDAALQAWRDSRVNTNQ